MIDRFELIRNTGQFASVSPPVGIAFTPFTLIYAENGRGKTTMASIFRSLATGDANLVLDRKRLGSQHPPHIVVSQGGRQSIFQNGTWSQALPDIGCNPTKVRKVPQVFKIEFCSQKGVLAK